MPKAAYCTPEHKAFKRWLANEDIDCHWCGRARATVPDHEPPLRLYGGSVTAWRAAGGEYVPACARCNRSRGAKLANALRRSPPAFTGTLRPPPGGYPPSTW